MHRQTSNHLLLALILMGLFTLTFCLSSKSLIFKNSFAQPLSHDNPLGVPANAYATTGTLGYLDNGSSNSNSGSGAGGNNQIKPNNVVQFNHYENNEIGISLKYPSNFLIDESNSNNTLRQISFYPSNSQTISSNPEQYILWMDVFVSTPSQQHPLLSLSNRFSSTPSLGSSPDLSSYSLNLAHSIQQANKDVSVIGSSSNVTLSGHPAYKLITKSYIGNTAIVDVLISTLVNNTVYSLDFQSNLLNYLNSISDTNKIIQSFEIFSPTSLASTNTLSSSQSSSFLSQPPISSSSPLPSSSQLPSLQQPETSNTKPSNSLLIPLLSSLLSNSQLNDIANNSTHILKSLKNSLTNSINDVLSNPQNAINNTIKGTTSLIPTTPSELSSLPSTALKKACGLPFVSDVCTQIGNSVSKDQNPSGESSTSTSNNNNRSNNTGSNSISNNAAINRDNGIIDNGTIGANINREMNIGNGKSNANNDNVIGNVKLNSNNNGSAITNSTSTSSGGGSSNNSTGIIENNNKRNSLITSLENLFSAKTSNSSNQSLSSNSSILGSGLSFLKKLLFLHSTPSSSSSITTSNYPFSSHSSPNPPLSQMNTPSHLNSSNIATTTTTINRINQSNSTIMSPSLSSNSSSLPPSSSSLPAPPPSSYIPPPIH